MPAEMISARPFRCPRIVLLLLFVLLVCARMPDIVLHGRFWAEEGHNFFHNAAVMPWRQALLAPVGGYLNIVANLAGLLARHLVPLRQAPFVTIAVAMACQACPILVLLTAQDPWLRRTPVLLAATLILATPVASDEVWLNSIHGQFHLALANALTLALEPAVGVVGLFRLVLLMLGPLAGPASLFLLPLFGLRLVIERCIARLSQVAMLAAGSLVQFLCFYTPTAARSYGIGLTTFAGVLFEKHLVLPLLGRRAAQPIGDQLHGLLIHGAVPLIILLTTVTAFVLLSLAALRSRVPAARWLFLGAMLIELLSDYGAVDGRTSLIWASFGERYAFVPSVLLSLLILALAVDRRRRLTAGIAGFLVLWIIGIGLHDELGGRDAFFAHGPNWTESVRAWQSHPSGPIAIWPSGWDMIIPLPAAQIGWHVP